MMSSIESHVCQYIVTSFVYCMHAYIRVCNLQVVASACAQEERIRETSSEIGIILNA
jgi:hypothetical protein